MSVFLKWFRVYSPPIGHTSLRLTTSMILTCVLTIPCPSPKINWFKNRPFAECSFASGSDVDANSAMGKPGIGCKGSVAKTCSTLPCSRHPSIVAGRAGILATCLFSNSSNRVHTLAGIPGSSSQPVGLNARVRQKAWEMWRHHGTTSTQPRQSPTKRHRPRREGGGKDITTISQRATRIVEGASTKEDEHVACPRCDRELHVFNTASGPIMRCRGWNLAGDTVYFDQKPAKMEPSSLEGRGVPTVPQVEVQRVVLVAPATLSGQDNGVQDPPPINDWTALAADPAWAQEQVRPVATTSSTISTPSISTAAHGVVDSGPLESASRGRRIHWGRLECGYGKGSDRCVSAQSNTTSESESLNHRQDWCGNARSNERVRDEPVFTASQSVTEHTLETKQEDKVQELAKTIRECGISPRHRPLAVFWTPAGQGSRSHEFNPSSQD